MNSPLPPVYVYDRTTGVVTACEYIPARHCDMFWYCRLHGPRGYFYDDFARELGATYRRIIAPGVPAAREQREGERGE